MALVPVGDVTVTAERCEERMRLWLLALCAVSGAGAGQAPPVSLSDPPSMKRLSASDMVRAFLKLMSPISRPAVVRPRSHLSPSLALQLLRAPPPDGDVLPPALSALSDVEPSRPPSAPRQPVKINGRYFRRQAPLQ